MTRVFFVLFAVLLVSTAAEAKTPYYQQGIFGGRQELDGYVNVRNPVELYNTARIAEAGVSVANRPRPEYDPLGFRLGSFQFYPSVELGGTFDSNVFAENNTNAMDVLWQIRPAVSLFSNWSRHAISFAAQGDIGMYTDRSTEDFSDGVMLMRGRYDVQRGTFMTYGGDFQRLTEQRTSPNSALSAEAATYNTMGFFGRANHRQGMFDFETQLDLKRYDYDGIRNNAGVRTSQDFRDRNQYRVLGEVGYELQRFWRPFIRANYNWRNYDNFGTRDSSGYDIVGGTGFEFSGGIITGEVFLGHMNQTYKNFLRGKESAGAHFGGSVLWNITGVTSLEAEVDRSIEETTLAGYHAAMATGGALTLTRELRRNLLLEANMDVTRNDFEGGPDRVDDNYRMGVGTRYFFNRNFYSDFEYNFAWRQSDVQTAEFDRHLISLRVGSQY